MTKTTTIPLALRGDVSEHFVLTIHATYCDPDTLSPRNCVLNKFN